MSRGAAPLTPGAATHAGLDARLKLPGFGSDSSWMSASVAHSASPFPPRGHVPVLDGVRGLAILVVIFYHARNAMRPDGGMDATWSAIGSVGWFGVDLFFVLSGFLITGILLDSKSDSRCVPRFFVRRILRIFPLYYLYLFVMIILWPRIGISALNEALLEIYSPWVYVFYLQNVMIPIHGAHGIMAVTWSLAIEEQFYLLWPFVVVALGRVQLRRACLVLLLLPLFWRFLVATYEMGPWHAYTPLWARADTLAMGALLAMAVRRREALGRPAVIAAFVVAILSAGGLVEIFRMNGNLDFRAPRVFTLGFSCVALLHGSLIFLVLRFRELGFVRGLFANEWIRLCGKYSYCMYLAHLSFRELLVGQVWGGGPPSIFGSQIAGQLVLFVGMTVGSLAVGHLTWRYWESPFLSLKERLPSLRPAPGATHEPEPLPQATMRS